MALDERLQKLVHRAYESGGERGEKVKSILNGVWLGHPLHPALTDVPVGAWTVAEVCDAAGGLWTSKERELEAAAEVAIAVGIAGALAAAVTGLTDWQDVDPPARSTGLLHGLLNLGGTALFASSLVARRRRARGRGKLLSTAGYGVMLAAARLGGDMVYNQRVGVDRTAGQSFPQKFTPVMAAADLIEGEPRRVGDPDSPILLVRRGQRVFALAETCSHFGGPLSEGSVIGDTIQCPWHGSRFDLGDGHVVEGPAVHQQPCFEVRIEAGQIEVCLSPCASPKRATVVPLPIQKGRIPA